MAKESKFLKSQAENPSPAQKVGEAHWSVRHPATEKAPADTMISNQLGHCIMDTAASVCPDVRKQ